MPRPKKDGAGPPKTRSRFGCWPCKARKVKCGEEKPTCKNCQRQGETCDYSIRLNWAGRSKSSSGDFMISTQSLPNSPSTIVFPSPEIFSGSTTPKASTPVFGASSKPSRPSHGRSRSNVSTPVRDNWNVDPLLFNNQDGKQQSPGFLAPPGNGSMARSMEQRSEAPVVSGIPGAQYLRSSWQFPTSSGIPSGLVVPMPDSKSPLYSNNTTDNGSSTPRPQSGGESYAASADRSKRVRLNSDSESSSGPILVPYESPQEGQLMSSPPMLAKSPNNRFLVPSPFPGTPQTTGSSASDEQGSRIFWKTGAQRFSQTMGAEVLCLLVHCS